jgi:Flp pilus assembly protein TadB
MEASSVPLITSAVAPVVMVSAAGLLFMGVQAKNLHLSDRIRSLTAEYRALAPTAGSDARRRQIAQQLHLFERRIRLSQHSLELLSIAIVCFVLTSLLLTAGAWLGGLVGVVAGVFVLGVALLVAALVLEFMEMRVGLRTIAIEIDDALRGSRGDARGSS